MDGAGSAAHQTSCSVTAATTTTKTTSRLAQGVKTGHRPPQRPARLRTWRPPPGSYKTNAAEDAAGRIVWDGSVGSTVVRAHQHAVGARTLAASGRQKGNVRSTNRVDPALRELARRLEEVIWSASCQGRSRGGFTTNIHLADEGRCRPLTLVLTSRALRPTGVLERVSVPRNGVGRPRTRPDHVLANKAYTSRKNRRYLRHRAHRPGTSRPQKHRKNRRS